MSRTVVASLAVAIVAALAPQAAEAQKRHPVSEVFIGIVDHDAGVFGRNKEDGPDVNVEWRFDPPEFRAWELLLSPRPTIGANINTQDDTNTLYLAATWTAEFWGGFFFDWSMGGALHDGETDGEFLDKKSLGSPVLFYLAAGLGYRFWDHHSLSIRLDHISNAKIFGDNDGLDTVGIRYSYRF